MSESEQHHGATLPQSRSRRNVVILAAVAVGAVAVVFGARLLRTDRISLLTGTIVRDGAGPGEQLPVSGALVAVTAGATAAETTSDISGFFELRLNPPLYPGEPLDLRVRHPDYESVEITEPAQEKIYVVRASPKEAEIEPVKPRHTVRNVRVRYGVKNTTIVNVGSAVRSFEVVNTGNLPCAKSPPCSPDGKWKAAEASVSLDAGEGNQFGRARVSCIAGPCPFSEVSKEDLSADRRLLHVGVRNWSDTVTYLVEAEVADAMVNDMVRHSYPVIFGSSMNFTLPAGAQGPSIEADLDGVNVVFPLGRRLILSWANCSVEESTDRTLLYRCKLKPGFHFE